MDCDHRTGLPKGDGRVRQRVTCCEPQPDSWYRTVNTLRLDRTDDAREVRSMHALWVDVGRLTYIPPYDGRYARPPKG